MTEAERAIALRVDRVLPALAARAEEADRAGEFPLEHVRTISDAGLLGITVPVAYGGLGGGLRDLAAATFALATACPSTALAYYFQCSGSSRGLLPLAAIEAGLFAPRRGAPGPLVRRAGAEADGRARPLGGQLRQRVGAVQARRHNHHHRGLPHRRRMADQRGQVVRLLHRRGRRLPRHGQAGGRRDGRVAGHVPDPPRHARRERASQVGRHRDAGHCHPRHRA